MSWDTWAAIIAGIAAAVAVGAVIWDVLDKTKSNRKEDNGGA